MTTPEEAPEPEIETVTIAKNDFELMQTALGMAAADMGDLCHRLRLAVPAGMSPATAYAVLVIPRVVTLMDMNDQMAAAEAQIQKLITPDQRFGGKTVQLPDGRTAQQVGQRLPHGTLPKGMDPRDRRR